VIEEFISLSSVNNSKFDKNVYVLSLEYVPYDGSQRNVYKCRVSLSVE
jgi:hypothetical protein